MIASRLLPGQGWPILTHSCVSNAGLVPAGTQLQTLVRRVDAIDFFDRERDALSPQMPWLARTGRYAGMGLMWAIPIGLCSAYAYVGDHYGLADQLTNVKDATLHVIRTWGFGMLEIIFRNLDYAFLFGIGEGVATDINKKYIKPPKKLTIDDVATAEVGKLKGVDSLWNKAMRAWAGNEHEATATHLTAGMNLLLAGGHFVFAELYGNLAGLAWLTGEQTEAAREHFRNMADRFGEAGATKAAARSRMHEAYSAARFDGIPTDGLQRQLAIRAGLNITRSDLQTYWNSLVTLLGFPNVEQSPMAMLLERTAAASG